MTTTAPTPPAAEPMPPIVVTARIVEAATYETGRGTCAYKNVATDRLSGRRVSVTFWTDQPILLGTEVAISTAPGAPTPPSIGVEMIGAERVRQITDETWTPEHDDEHVHGELSDAAICYAIAATGNVTRDVMDSWPWAGSWWKPSEEPIRNLVKAGALIAAEIDRLVRATR